MMLETRLADDRGLADFGWLHSRHSFSFGHYYDPRHMGFGPLRVINEDRVAPGRGFGAHGHRDMEILSYVLEGALEHRDSLGNGSIIRPGDVQRMSAGTGVVHSEYNASQTQPVHFLQIWIEPAETGLPPGYEQKTFAEDDKRGRLRLVASGDGRDGAVRIHRAVDLYASVLDAGDRVSHTIIEGRLAWIQIASGDVSVNGRALMAGDGIPIRGPLEVALTGTPRGEVLLFDMG